MIPERPVMMASTPRSGTDWFCNAVLGRADFEGGYCREFFNTDYAREEYRADLARAFGSEDHWRAIATPWERQIPEIDDVFGRTWGREAGRWDFDKEVWGAFKIGFFRRHFEVLIFVGHRAFTFPGGSRPADTAYWWTQYYRSLVHNAPVLDADLAALVEFAIRETRTPHEEMCAAQVIATYQLLKEARRFGLPVVEYRRLMQLPDERSLDGYLAERLPGSLRRDGLGERIVRGRHRVDVKKAAAYEDLGVEDFSRRLIARLPSFEDCFL